MNIIKGGVFIHRKLFTVLLVIAMIISISAVCASDNDVSLNETETISTSQDINEELSVSEDTLLSEDDTNLTFSDLSTTINSASSNIDLDKNYVFNQETDGNYVNGIVIKKDNFIINGNNHVIDAKDNARIFTITGKNVTLKNIVFKNSNSMALNLTRSEVTSTNVTFMNCGDSNKQGGAVYVYESLYESNNDTFIENYAKYGSAIYSSRSNVTIVNDKFKNSENIYWSLIYAFDSNLKVADTTFANVTSKYATAIYAEQTLTNIRNSKFINLYATTTAGAIGLKIAPSSIEDCEFHNVSSTKNGGAIFADADQYDATVLVNNTLFENCTSDFGGALLQLSGNCIIDNSTFNNNLARYDGGAVYVSTVKNMKISNSKFTNNNCTIYDDYPSCGGAAHIDNSVADVRDTEFTNNHAPGGALFFYDSNYALNNLAFYGNGTPIFTYFEEEFERNNLTWNGTKISEDYFNKTYYPSVVYGPGKQLKLVENPLPITDLPSRLNLVDYGLVTPVKNQGSQLSCWAFGTIASLESALLMKTNKTYDFSENNLQNSMLCYSKYGSITSSEGGYSNLGFAYLLNWFGALNQTYDEYDELGKISPLLTTGEEIHIQDVVLLPYQAGDLESITDVKKAIVEYGALMGVICFGATAYDQGPSTYNEKYYSLYTPNFAAPNHMICVVGWDDNFPKENFTVPAPGDGAWIVKNSWGTEWGDNGYFYVSYYDQTLCNYDMIGIGAAFVGIEIENTLPYNKNYQYDFIGLYDYSETDGSTYKSTNSFVAEEDDVIAAVGTYLYPNSNYTIEILINDTLIYKQQGISPYYGYHTVKLDKYVFVKKGEKFSAVLIVDDKVPISTGSRVKYQPGSSISETDITSQDDSEYGTVTCIKVYTLDEPFSAERIIETYSERKPFKVNVSQSYVDVSISFDNKTMTNKSDENGIATFNLPLLEHGIHPIYVSYNGSALLSSVTVLSTIDVPDVITAAHDGNSNITVTFYDTEGNKLNSMTLPLPTKMGTYNLSFTNYKTGEVRNSTINVVSRFLSHRDATLCYGSVYSVVVAGDDGKHAREGENVTFEIMGKRAIAETSELGVAAVYLPLEAVPGTYVITMTCRGERVNNTITIEHAINSNKTVSVYLTDNSLTLKATLIYEDKAFVNDTVTFKLNGKTYTTTVDSFGIAKVVINQNDIKKLKAGKYTIEIAFKKEIFKTTLEVKQPLTSASKVTIKNIDKKLVLKATLKYDNVPLANKKITFKFREKTYSAVTDKNGIAKVTIKKNVIKKLKAGGKYTATISYQNDVIKTTVKVKKILSAKKTVKVKKSAKKLVLKATLKDGKTPLKKKKITFKFKGKTYKAKTNKKGIAKVTIKKKVIKKLKAGKKYTAKITYLNNVVKTKVKVKK